MSKRLISKQEWETQLSQIKLEKSELNKLVMNYLIIEGYKEAAEKFQKESGTSTGIDLNSISDRMAIRTAIQSGNIEEGITGVNDLNPEILDTNPVLYFHLQQQRLIELIKKGQIMEAIKFAQEELAIHGEQNSTFLDELEKTMALLAFEDHTKSPIGNLLDISQRQKTASELNAAILMSQCQEKDPKLPTLLKMLIWSQNQLEERAKFPRVNDLFTTKLELKD